MSDVETWRVECDGGAVVEARVWDAVHAFDETRIAVLIVADGTTTPMEFHRDHSRRSAVAWAAGLARLSVASILAPGQLTRAEVERDLAATRADLEAALMSTEARSVDLLVERTLGAEWMRATCADLCNARAVQEGSNALQFAANAIRALPLPVVIETKDEETLAEVEAQLAEARAANANFIEHIEAANGLEIRALKVTT